VNRRDAVLRVADYFVPSDWGDDRFAELVAGHWTPGAGTTCTYLPAAALYLVGCRDERLVNHDDDQGRTAFTVAAGVSKLVQGARAIGAWVDDAPGREPQPGDVVFISNGPPLTEHVELVLDPAEWRAASAGQSNARGEQAARVVTRQLDDRRGEGGPRLLSAPSPLPVVGSWRKLQGWVDLDKVPWVEAPMGPAAEPMIAPSVGGLVAGFVLAGVAVGLVAAVLRAPVPPWPQNHS
jgi:hypothetical protein